MGWTGYQIRLRLLSPLHIGWRKSGNLQQTRPYVTGRTLWGALTSTLTRQAQSSDYKGYGDRVDSELAFTYFYPITLKNDEQDLRDDSVCLWPWGNDWDEFAWTYLGSYVSTALADGHGAEEGSLHETEFISPFTRDGKPVYLVGYLFVQENSDLLWENALKKLQLGGERGYGWGTINTVNPVQSRPIKKDDACFGKFKFADDDQDRPLFQALADNTSLLAHTLVNGENLSGEIEPLVGRTTTPAGEFGQSHSNAKICWKPGTTITEAGKYKIQPKGLWQILR